MNLCVCPRPVRDLAHVDRLRCAACAGLTPYGRTPDPTVLRRQVQHAIGRLLHLVDEYRWACEYVPRRPPAVGRNGDRSDPTGNGAVDPQAATIAAWRTVAARAIDQLLERADLADAALGEARYVADPGPSDHVRAPYHEPVPANRPDLVEAHAAKARRRARGDL